MALLRTIMSYVLGTALIEATWASGQAGGCGPVTADLVGPGFPATRSTSRNGDGQLLLTTAARVSDGAIVPQ